MNLGNLIDKKNDLDRKAQALISNGEQSAGNFFISTDPNIQKIKSSKKYLTNY